MDIRTVQHENSKRSVTLSYLKERYSIFSWATLPGIVMVPFKSSARRYPTVVGQHCFSHFDFINGCPKYKIDCNWLQLTARLLSAFSILRKDTWESNILEWLRIGMLIADGWNRANARTMSHTGYNRMVTLSTLSYPTLSIRRKLRKFLIQQNLECYITSDCPMVQLGYLCLCLCDYSYP